MAQNTKIDINQYIGKQIPCSCRRIHETTVKCIDIARGAAVISGSLAIQKFFWQQMIIPGRRQDAQPGRNLRGQDLLKKNWFSIAMEIWCRMNLQLANWRRHFRQMLI